MTTRKRVKKELPPCQECGKPATETYHEKQLCFSHAEALMHATMNYDLCFLCQEEPPTHIITSNAKSGETKVCEDCAKAAEAVNDQNNRVKKALHRGDRLGIWTMTLGMSLLPIRLEIKKLGE